MGYYVWTDACEVVIPSVNLQEGFELACALNAHEDKKTGGVYRNHVNSFAAAAKPKESKSVAETPDRWFSWMPWNYDELAKDLKEILDLVGFESHYNMFGDLSITGYDSKWGCQDVFIECLAPVILEGSFIDWHTEDDCLLRHFFHDGRFTCIESGLCRVRVG